MPPRKYPAPPTGHDLMAMFPPAPPDNFPEMRPGPTSGYFQRQERAFFAQAGKEIVRVQVEVDLPNSGDTENGHSKTRAVPRPWPPPGASQPGTSSQHHSPAPSSAAPPLLYPHPSSRPSQRGPVPVTPATLFPVNSSHASPSVPSPSSHHHTSSSSMLQSNANAGLRTPPQESAPAKTEYPSDDFRDDPDEAWRRPMPYAERRRAGKHTRRVVVRN